MFLNKSLRSELLRKNFASFFQKYRLSVIAFFGIALLPITFNIYALRADVGANTFQELLNGTYICPFGFKCNPFPEIILDLLKLSLIISLATQFPVFLSAKCFPSNPPKLIKLFCMLPLLLATGYFVGYVSSRFLPLVWLPRLHNYNFGLPASKIAITHSWHLVLPAVFALIVSVYVRVGESKSSEPTSY